MYKADDKATAKVLYSTNRTCAMVMYNTHTKVLYFPRPIVFTSQMHLYIERAGNHIGGCLYRM